MSLTWYRNGSVAVTNGSATVTGTGTAWLAIGISAGDVFIGPDGEMYEITAVASDTSITIKLRNGSTHYGGSTASNAAYAIIPQVNSTTNAQLASQLSTLLTKWQGREDEFAAWMGGTITGGALNPDGTGTGGPYYKMTSPAGAVSWAKCPASLTVNIPSGDLAATTVQGAITELEAEKAKLAGSATQAFSALTPDATDISTRVATTILVKNEARAAVESASGGHQTILYSADGYPSVMNIVPAFNKEDIDAGLGTGRHSAFIVNGVNKAEIFIGAYQGIVRGTNFVSQPNVHPTVTANFDTFLGWVATNGPGWHLITNAERAAIAMWSWKNGTQPRGNNNWGRDISALHEAGRRTDGHLPGVAVGDGVTLTGSGPASWRHDGNMHGISDLNGNIWEWATGMRINGGEIQVLPDNNAADNTLGVSAGSTLWKAIDGASGTLVAPGSAGTVKYATSEARDYNLVCGSGAAFESMTNPGGTPVGATALALLKSLGLFPVAGSGLGGDVFYVDVTGERVPIFGGNWHNSGAAGVFTLNLNYPRSFVSSTIGSRPAYVL